MDYECPDCEGTGFNYLEVMMLCGELSAEDCPHEQFSDDWSLWMDENWEDYIEEAKKQSIEYQDNLCSRCKGTGKIDWVTNAMRGGD